jgi:hypothetical protein
MTIAIRGGGMYGCVLAEHLQESGYNVIVFEKESDILLGASSKNFRRLHAGFHYPKSLRTALESSRCYDMFLERYGEFCEPQKTHYHIANDSQVGWSEYRKFALKLGRNCTFSGSTADRCHYMLECKESLYDVDAMREHFNETLTIYHETDLGPMWPASGVVIDCTYVNSPLADKWQLKQATILRISAPLPKIAQTVLYGPYCGYVPDGDGFRFYHAKETSPRKMLEDGQRYFPELRRAVVHEVITCNHVHPPSRSDDRPYKIERTDDKEISVLSGKIAQSLDCAHEVKRQLEGFGIMPDSGQAGERQAAVRER